jgi:hypothetical protein
LAIIHKNTWPNLATHHRGKQKCLGILAIIWQHAGQPGFFLRILWYSQGGDHSETILAQFWLHARYESRKKNQDPSIFLALPTGTYCRNFMIWILFSFWNLANLDHFSHENSFLYVKITFFKSIFCKKKLPIKIKHRLQPIV